jgi:hypothetical protein
MVETDHSDRQYAELVETMADPSENTGNYCSTTMHVEPRRQDPSKVSFCFYWERGCPIWVSYHTTAMRSLISTNLVATVPRRMAELEASNPAIKILKAAFSAI